MDRWHSIPVSNDIINDTSSSDSSMNASSINDTASTATGDSFHRWCNGRLDHATGLCAQFGELCLNAHFDSAGDFVAPSNGNGNGTLHHDDTDFVAEQVYIVSHVISSINVYSLYLYVICIIEQIASCTNGTIIIFKRETTATSIRYHITIIISITSTVVSNCINTS